MIFSSRCRKRSDRRGAAAVELALIAPLFFVVIFGIIEVGRLLMVQEILVNAARTGSRVAVMPGNTDSNVTTAVSNFMAGTGISGYTATLSPTIASGPTSGTAMTMTVSVPWSTVSWFSYATWLNGQTLSCSVAMIRE
jgi:Flp pilus assembly protein TadG